jgi:hypothetical protein
MPEGTWIEQLRDFLCRLYEEWGGDCSQLPFPVPDRIAEQWKTYNAEGAPKFSGEPARVAYLQLLTDIETHLDHTNNTLSEPDDTSLRNLTAQLRSDVNEGG